MTVQPIDLHTCATCGGTLLDMGLRPDPDSTGQIWVYMCQGCRRDVVHQYMPA